MKPANDDCQGIIGLIEDTFSAIDQQQSDLEIRDLSILFYLQNIESIEAASFKMLNLAVPLIGNQEISQLFKENFDEAREDLTLLLMISGKYFKA